nr:hypothetical protein [Endozoicomonas sp.]
MSIWDETIDGNSADQQIKNETPVASDRLQELMKEFKSTGGLIDSLKEKLDVIREEILDFFPKEPGKYEQVSQGGTHFLEVSISEKWTWDETKLAELTDEKELPYFVKRKLSVDKRKFERLEGMEKDVYLDALTRAPGVARISVKVIPQD